MNFWEKIAAGKNWVYEALSNQCSLRRYGWKRPLSLHDYVALPIWTFLQVEHLLIGSLTTRLWSCLPVSFINWSSIPIRPENLFYKTKPEKAKRRSCCNRAQLGLKTMITQKIEGRTFWNTKVWGWCANKV